MNLGLTLENELGKKKKRIPERFPSQLKEITETTKLHSHWYFDLSPESNHQETK